MQALANPLVRSLNGFLCPIDANGGNTLWYHASWSPRTSPPIKKFSRKASARYDATFFSTSVKFAGMFGREKYIGSECCLTIYGVRIGAVKLFDIGSIYETRGRDILLSQEGEVFAERLAYHLKRDKISLSEFEVLESLRSGHWEGFDSREYPASLYYASLLSTFVDLGYRGWLEFEEDVDIRGWTRVLNIALLYPDQDATIVKSRQLTGRLNPSPKPSVAAMVVVHDGKILILQRGWSAPWEPNKWNLPGGNIDDGESPEDAARRETFEETGIYINVNTPISSLGIAVSEDGLWALETFIVEVDDISRLPIDVRSKHARYNLLPVSPELGHPESDDYRWIALQDVTRYEFVPLVNALLMEALEDDQND